MDAAGARREVSNEEIDQLVGAGMTGAEILDAIGKIEPASRAKIWRQVRTRIHKARQ